ncbi:MAG: response regulator [Fusobacteriaceae bacterium]|nr:response regulator [Fusobacteriaceae bacterium]
MDSLRILLAEDEFLCLIGIKNNLEDLGHEVIGEASDGLELVDMALKKKPQLILTDINMPFLSGIEAVKKINDSMTIPTIIISGYHEDKLIEEASDLGIFNYLVKPVDLRDLKIAIEVSMARFKDYKKMEEELENTKNLLEERKIIEKAKGILMKHQGLSENEAFIKLQKMSKDKNKKMILVANEIIEAAKLLS